MPLNKNVESKTNQFGLLHRYPLAQGLPQSSTLVEGSAFTRIKVAVSDRSR
jgi:hypothetical protein